MKSRTKIVDLIIAIIAGIAVWSYIINYIDPIQDTTIRSVPVQLLNVDSMQESGLAISGTGEYTVDVVINGARSDLSDVNASDFIATADVSGLNKGQNYINVNLEAPGHINVVELRTQKIQVYVESFETQAKALKIVCDNKKADQELGSLKLDESEFTVSGAHTLVESVVSIQANIDVKEMAADDSFTKDVHLIPVDSDGKIVEGVKLSKDSISITASLYNTKEVALNVPIVGEFNDRVKLLSEIIPNSIVIKGPSDKLSDIWIIDAQPIDRSKISESCNVSVEAVLPEGVEVTKASSNLTVAYEVLGRTEEVFVFNNDSTVYYLNVPEGITPTLISEISVVVSVYEDEAEMLNDSDIIVSIDMASYDSGTHELPVSVNFLRTDIEGLRMVDAPLSAEVEYTPAQAATQSESVQ